jgi:hypothetical protein
MTLPLVVHSLLFNYYQGRRNTGWYVGNEDSTSVAKQNATIDEMDKYGANTIALNLMNEELSTLFKGEFMNSAWDNYRVDLITNFIVRLKQRGKNVVIVFFDGPAVTPASDAKHPFLRYWDRLVPFAQIATKALAPIVDGFLIGIETHRYASSDDVENAIDAIRPLAFRMINGVRYNIPISSHEQHVSWGLSGPYCSRRILRNSDFVCLETSWHPLDQANSVSVSDMVREVQCAVDNANGKGVWVCEMNGNYTEREKEQFNAVSRIQGVIGVDGRGVG